MEKIKLHFTSPILDVVANAFGYATHTKYMRQYMQEYFEYDDNADIALTITSADKFVRIPGKFNILFTMWEFLDLPKSYIERIQLADAIITPSSFCGDLFARYTKKPVYVCQEGVEIEKYIYFNREGIYRDFINRKRRFRILWVGAPNPRKGYPLVLEAIKLFERYPGVEVYLKTTMPKINIRQCFKSVWKNRYKIFRNELYDENGFHRSLSSYFGAFFRMLRRIPHPQLADRLETYGKYKNIIFDTRKLELKDLVALYNSAHCFVLPTYGEGWGLTLCEAMATGCPCIATAVTGCADFFDDYVGYPIAYSIQPFKLENYDNLVTKGYIPDTKDFIEKIIYVMTHYQEALKKGLKASRRIHNRFSWSNSARRMYEIVREINKNRQGFICV